MKNTIICCFVIVLTFNFINKSVVFGCNEGGPMGFASKKPGMFFVNITYSSTFVFASTSGTSGCKNWDFIKNWSQTKDYFVASQWHEIQQEIAQGEGVHLDGLAQIMGCDSDQYQQFSTLMHDNYQELFEYPSVKDSFQQKQFVTQIDNLLYSKKVLSLCKIPFNKIGKNDP